MSHAEGNQSAGQGPGESLAGRVGEALERLDREVALRRKAAGALRPLGKTELFRSPGKLGKAEAKARSRLGAEEWGELGLSELLEAVKTYVEQAPARLRRELWRELKERCGEEGVEVRVVSQETPPEVRLVPFSVVLDIDKGRADLRFAREVLASSALEVGAILEARGKLVEELGKGFDPAAFFEACRKAYERVVLLDGLQDGERVEILRLLPELAFLLQPKRFHQDPVARNFRPYSRGRLAYDMYLLRQAGGLSQGGIRLNVGVATGRTATQKKRVIYMEDGRGRGEFKLNLYFTRAESDRGAG